MAGIRALLLSCAAHAAAVLLIAHRAPRSSLHTVQPSEALFEIAALDLAPTEAAVPAEHPHIPSVALRHSHPYPVPPGHDLTPHDEAFDHVPALSEHDAEPAAAPSVIAAPAAEPPRFVLTVAGAPGLGRSPSPGASPASEPVPEAAVDTAATLLAGNSASYTPEAEAAGVEANVPLEIVIDGSGTVIGARALAHVGYGLDEAAVRGVRSYRFSPARRAGRALAVRMRWVMRFQLR